VRRNRESRNKKEKMVISFFVLMVLVLYTFEPGSKTEVLAISVKKQPINIMYSMLMDGNVSEFEEMNGLALRYYRTLKSGKFYAAKNHETFEGKDVNYDPAANKEVNEDNEKSNHSSSSAEKPKEEKAQEPVNQQINLKKVYLTFDDGPSAYTSSILEALNARGMKATFFMLEPNMNKYPDQLKQMIGQGHVPALHGVTHDAAKIYRSEKTVVAEMSQAQATLMKLTGSATTLIRTPYGSSPYMKPSYIEAVEKAGFQLWDWTVDSRDWQYRNGEFVGQVINQIEHFKFKDRPIVILMHDRNSTAEHLPRLLDYLTAHGYETELLSQQLTAFHF